MQKHLNFFKTAKTVEVAKAEDEKHCCSLYFAAKRNFCDRQAQSQLVNELLQKNEIQNPEGNVENATF